MATFKVNESFLIALEAAADLTGALKKLVKVDTNGNVALALADDKALGVVYEVPLSANVPYGPATIQFAGIAKVLAGAAVAAGSRVKCDSTSRVIEGSTNPVGIALDSPGAAGVVCTVAMVN